MRGFQGRRIMVSGGDGILGRPVVFGLLQLGLSVTLVCSGKQEYESLCSAYPECTITSLENLGVLGDEGGPEAILFLNNPEILPNDQVDKGFIENELSVLKKLLELAGKYASYFLYASSASVYGKQRYLPIDEDHPLEPNLLFGAVKLAGEYFCRAAALESGFLYTILRFGDIYGPGSKGIGTPAVMLHQAIKGEPVLLQGRGGQVRSFLYIDDAAEAVIRVLMSKTANQTLNIAGNEYYSLWHLANLIKSKISLQSDIVTEKDKLEDELECCIDSVKAQELLGFSPRHTLLNGLLKTHRWMLSNHLNR